MALVDPLVKLSLKKSESLDDKSENFGSESRSSSTYSFCYFPLLAEESIAGVFAPDFFSPTVFESKGDLLVSIFLLSL